MTRWKLPACAALVLTVATVWTSASSGVATATARLPLTFAPLQIHVRDLFGLNTSIARRYPSLAGPALHRLRLLKTHWVREEITPSSLHHQTKAPYEFGPYDRVINQEWRDHLHILGLLDYNNSFDSLTRASMPHAHIVKLTNDFVAFVTAVVTHYKGKIENWQIWNEPDIYVHWRPYANAADYAYLLTRSYQAIKQIEPLSQVVVAGPSGSDANAIAFLQQVVTAGGLFDVVAMQPYSPTPGPTFISKLDALHAFHKPIWLTEMGWAGDNGCQPCGSAYFQATRLAVSYLIAATHGVQRMFWYDFRDDGIGQTYRDAFGLVTARLAGKDAFRAYELSEYMLGGRTIDGVANLNPDVTMWRISLARRIGYVALNRGSTSQTLTLSWNLPRANMFDSQGHTHGYSSNHALTLEIGPDRVVYILPRALQPKLVNAKRLTPH